MSPEEREEQEEAFRQAHRWSGPPPRLDEGEGPDTSPWAFAVIALAVLAVLALVALGAGVAEKVPE